jgi:hypothetical protein
MNRNAHRTVCVSALLFALAGFAAPVVSAQPAIAANEVRLCEHPDFLGTCHSIFLDPGMRQRLVRTLPGGMDDEVSSIRIGSGVVAVGFTHKGFQGRWCPFLQDSRDLKKKVRKHNGIISESTGKNWNDWISSLIVTRRSPGNSPMAGELTGVAVFQFAPWRGDEGACAFYPLPQDQSLTKLSVPQLGDYLNDKVSVVSLRGNVEVELYENTNYQGKRLDLPGESGEDRFELDCCSMDGKVSSLIVRYTGGKVEAQGQTPPLLPPERIGEAAGDPHRAPAAPMEAVVAGPITVPQAPSMTLESNTDRFGHNYRDFDLRDARPELCRDACAADPRCLAYTYVKPGIQGEAPRCWLKDEVARATNAPCCVSGVKQ